MAYAAYIEVHDGWQYMRASEEHSGNELVNLLLEEIHEQHGYEDVIPLMNCFVVQDNEVDEALEEHIRYHFWHHNMVVRKQEESENE